MSFQREYIKYQLINNNILQHGDFTLKSGKKSNVFINLKNLVAYPYILSNIGLELCKLLEPFNDSEYYLCGVPLGAIPVSDVVGMKLNRPSLLIRDKVKDTGMKKLIEGDIFPFRDVIMIEDVVTTGMSLLEVVDKLESNGFNVVKVISVVFRGEDDVLEKLKKYNFEFMYHINDLTTPKISQIELASNTKSYIDTLKTSIESNNRNMFLALDSLSHLPFKMLLDLLMEMAKHIVGVKIHNEIMGFTYEENMTLYQTCRMHNLYVWEDRKFNDIGNTLQKQLKYYENIRDIVSIVPTNGVSSLKNIKTNLKMFVLCEMSTTNNLFNPILRNDIINVGHQLENVIGFICQDFEFTKFLKQHTNYLSIKPGIKLPISDTIEKDDTKDDKGQQWSNPLAFPVQSDIYVVGRGITESEDITRTAELYHNELQKVK